MGSLIILNIGIVSAALVGIISAIVLKMKPSVFSASLRGFNGVTIPKSIIFILLLSLLFWGVGIVEIRYTDQFRWSALFYIVTTAAWIDFERRIIPNGLIVLGLMVWAGVTLYSGFDSVAFITGVLLVLILLLMNKGSVYYFGKNGFGTGDLKLFFLIILLTGLEGFWLIALSVFIGGLFALIGILLHQIEKKSYLPFAPFLTLGITVGYFLISWDQAIRFLYGL